MIIKCDIEREIIRKTCDKSFVFFAKFFFKHANGSKVKFTYHLDVICQNLEDVFYGRTTHLIINIPPRYGKTEFVVKLFSAWCFSKNPASKFIHLSYSDTLVLNNSDAIKAIIKSEIFSEIYPDIYIVHNKDSKKVWETNHGGSFYATASGGAVTGFGAGDSSEYCEETRAFTFSGAIIIDDPIKPDEVKSDIKRNFINARWDETFKSRKNSKKTPVIVIMQRLHEEDFTGMLLKDTEFKWKNVVLPAILREGSEDEEALWQDKHSLSDLHKMKAKNPFVFASQMQQNPQPIEGELIKKEYWNFYLDHDEVMKRCNFFFFAADTAYTSNKGNDPSVIQFWGCESDQRMYLLDQIRGWLEYPALVDKILHIFNVYKKDSVIYIEAKASGLSLVQSLRQKGILASAWEPKKYSYPADKVGRVQESLWNIRNGDIWLPNQGIVNSVTESVIDFVDDFEAECTKFTADDTHKHDDQVDAMTMAISIWRYFSKFV